MYMYVCILACIQLSVEDHMTWELSKLNREMQERKHALFFGEWLQKLSKLRRSKRLLAMWVPTGLLSLVEHEQQSGTTHSWLCYVLLLQRRLLRKHFVRWRELSEQKGAMLLCATQRLKQVVRRHRISVTFMTWRKQLHCQRMFRYYSLEYT